jgi:hypothetical protein
LMAIRTGFRPRFGSCDEGENEGKRRNRHYEEHSLNATW